MDACVPSRRRISRGATYDADSWDTVVSDLEAPMILAGAKAVSAETWWQGGAFVGADWRSRLEFRATQAKALNASEAWWMRSRLDYQFAKLAADLGLRRHPPAMVPLR